jgi:GNAT superfamily N-acetyltransferase
MARRIPRNSRNDRSARLGAALPVLDPKRVRVRTANRTDLPLLVQHRRRMWEDIGNRTKAELDHADNPYKRWVVRETRARRFVGFIAETPNGSVAGSGAVWVQPAQPRPGRLARLEMPYILSMYTEPEFRRQGVASSLVRAMVRWATTRGYRRIFLHASRMGRSVYAKLGFVEGSEMRLDLPVRRATRRRPAPDAPPATVRRRGRSAVRSGSRRARRSATRPHRPRPTR